MKVLLTIASREVILLWRDRTFQVLLLVILALSAYTIFSSTNHYKHSAQNQEELTSHAAELLVNQKPKSAHMAGHYGHVVFKPATFLQAVDPGVNPFTGTTIRMEAHRQNEAVYAEASGQSSLVRFGQFSFSLLLQVVFPLLILFTCYRAVIADRTNGTLKLLISQGINLRQLIWGRVLAYTTVYWCFLLVTGLLYALVFSAQGGEGGAGFLRITSLFLTYGIYYLLLISLTVYFSARATNASGLLASLLAVWFLFTIIIPKSAANIGDHLEPLPTRAEFVAAINEKKPTGINGHDRNNIHTQRFIDSVLKAYQVDSASQLPVKLGGLVMQADEDFNNHLYDQALEGVNDIIARQNRVGSLSAFINPFMAIKNLSMATAGTDMYHHFHFTRDAEQYRRHLIQELNEQDALRQSDYKDERGRLTREFWEKLSDYRYQAPTIGWSLKNYKMELLALLFWLLLVVGLISFTSNKINIA